MAVAFEELLGSPKFSGTAEERTATRIGLIAWSDIDAFYQELFPPPSYGIPQLPAQFPPGSGIFANSVTFEPQFEHAVPTVTSPCNGYERAKVTVEYRTVPYEQSDPQTDQILTRKSTVGGQFVTLPASGLRWGDDGSRISNPDVQAAKLIGTIEHEVTVHRAVAVPWAAIRSLCGCVNSSPWYGAAIGTVLFLGVEMTQQVNAGGSTTYSIAYKFSERNINGVSVGWNYSFDPNTGSGIWRPVVTESGDPVYAGGNFNLLF